VEDPKLIDKNSRAHVFHRLIELIDKLRGEDGCPWDKKQTPKSIANYLIEEVYELVEAIHTGAAADILEELGDVLFHVFFIVKIFQEQGDFDFPDVIRHNTEKMIRRHPHVFENHRVRDVDEIRKNWRTIKMKEKEHMPNPSVLGSIPPGLPALMRAYRISERAAGTGFDWDDMNGVMAKVDEELLELRRALQNRNGRWKSDHDAALEFGDVLFTLVNVARFARIHPETALSESILKFQQRFLYMESAAREKGKPLESLTREEFDRLWEEAKARVGENAKNPLR
jgi:tetrapyrrole methylase family protein/MazG family protein